LNLIEKGGSEEGLLDESASRLDLLHVQTTNSGAVGSTSGGSAHGCERRSACSNACQGSGLEHGTHFLCSYSIHLCICLYLCFGSKGRKKSESRNKKAARAPFSNILSHFLNNFKVKQFKNSEIRQIKDKPHRFVVRMHFRPAILSKDTRFVKVLREFFCSSARRCFWDVAY
jgi:hypothetical protein